MLLSCACLSTAQGATPQINVSLGTLPADLVPKQALIKQHIVVAATMWASVVECKPCTIDISFNIQGAVEGDPKKLGFGKSTVSATFGDERKNDKIVSEQGMAAELRTGKDPNGPTSDVQIAFQTAYVLREFWWDPDPNARRLPVPTGKLDALSVILHELGHAMVFNGWIDPRSGKLDGTHMSTYDRWVTWNGRDFFFNGPAAMKVYGRPVILAHTVNNYHHVGEERPGVPIDTVLQNDLMTGYHLQWARRYVISPLDIAILNDCGFQTKK